MTGCKVVIVLMLANPMTRSSRFHKTGKQAGVQNYRLSVLDHPNVVDGEDTVPGATSREWVIGCVQDWCEVVSTHDEDNYTFTLTYDIPANDEGNGAHGPAGTIFLPNSEFLFRVMGVAPANFAGNTFVTPGRYEAARKRVIDLRKKTEPARLSAWTPPAMAMITARSTAATSAWYGDWSRFPSRTAWSITTASNAPRSPTKRRA